MTFTLDGDDLVLFTLVLARVAGIVTTGPVLGEFPVPVQFRVGLASVLSLIAFPLVRSALGGGVGPLFGQGVQLGVPLVLFVAVVKETMVGLMIGYLAKVMFYALQTAAYLMDFQMGLGMAAVFDPGLASQTSPVGSLMNWIATMVFLGIGGHRYLIQTLVNSFSTLPLGWAWAGRSGAMLHLVIAQLDQATRVAIGLFSPVIMVLGAGELALGVISKAAPQMNILMVSMPMKVWLGILAMLLWIGTLASPLGREMLAQLHSLPRAVATLIR